MDRRQWMRLGAVAAASGAAWPLSRCAADRLASHEAADAADPALGAHAASVPVRRAGSGPNALALQVKPAHAGWPVNRGLLGHNLQWVDRADEMFDAAGRLRADMLARARDMGCTSLRYPGGLQSDTYHWRLGLGALATRGSNAHAHSGAPQTTVAGTHEFLELCEALQAQPWITVNVATGTPQEAADWVRQVNVTGLVSRQTGQRLPSVPIWELGNEPYLQPDEQPTLWMKPEVFAQRAQAVARAMRAVDPRIRFSLPFTLDTRHGIQATPLPGYGRTVLATPIDGLSHLSLHNAYLPFGADREHPREHLYWAAMAAGQGWAADLRAATLAVRAWAPQLQWRWALTEYNALFSLGRRSDQLTLSPAGGLALASLLMQIAQAPDVDVAQAWSLSGNGFFGAIHRDGWLRPTGQVLALCHEALQGRRLPHELAAPTVDTVAVGFTPAATALPLAEALVTLEGSALRVLLLHKDPANPATFTLAVEGHRVVSARRSTLRTDDLFDTRDQRGAMTRVDAPIDVPAGAAALTLPVPPHSLSLLTLQLQPAAQT